MTDIETTDNKDIITFQELETIIGRWLLIRDKGLLKIITACALTTLLPSEPVWLLVVAGSGGAKTELLRGLYDLDFVHPLSDLTTNTFLSGDIKNPKGSLLHRLPELSLLIMKDFTTVIEMPNEKRATILSQLREIYDGDYRKDFGTGEHKEWQGKLGFIAGVTQVIDRHQTMFQMLGERFVKYYPSQADPVELAERALDNSGDEKLMRTEIRGAFKRLFAGVDIPEKLGEIPSYYKDSIIYLAAFCAKARSGVVRDGYNREIVFVPEPEHPTRLVKQLTNLFQALAIISGRFAPADYALIFKVGMDSLPTVRRLIVEELYSTAEPTTLQNLSMAANYPQGTVRRQLEELACLEIVKKSDVKGATQDYVLTYEARYLMERAVLEGPFDLPEKSQGVLL